MFDHLPHDLEAINDILHHLSHDFPNITVPDVIRTLFALAAGSVLLAAGLPVLGSRFLGYGKTALPTGTATGYSGKATTSDATMESKKKGPLDWLAGLTVPHSWFTHFYFLAVFWTIFWAAQILVHGSVYKFVAAYCEPRSQPFSEGNHSPTMSPHQLSLLFICFLTQTSRRLYEQLSSPPSSSRMWIGHYAIGLFFYTLLPLSLWTNAIPTISLIPQDSAFSTIFYLQRLITSPSLRTLPTLPIFFLASGLQRDCHTYLAGLKKYSIPEHPFFSRILCPHYAAEIVIYASLAVMGGVGGRVVDGTLAVAAGFVAVILGVAARGNREWYKAKFGEKVGKRWGLVPGWV
ncbi:putative 3-oxo-5-alpha-steroid 4-dehydrogenase [Pyronema domesticum]|nr:putative 3-oxo-5-alpha-steroid 4-dehydrogenase [Pyronema domesticum]